nr:hypothetical protein [Burkholderia pseudomallei]
MKHKPLRASQFVLPSKIPRQNVPSANRGVSRPRRRYRTTNAPSIPSVERRGTELIPARPANFSMHHTVRAPADNVRFPHDALDNVAEFSPSETGSFSSDRQSRSGMVETAVKVEKPPADIARPGPGAPDTADVRATGEPLASTGGDSNGALEAAADGISGGLAIGNADCLPRSKSQAPHAPRK